MALVSCDFFSEILLVGTSMTVVLPQPAGGEIGTSPAASQAPPPVLYLLHGLSDDQTAWTRRTSIERYATERGLAVVMPRVGRSFYQDERHGSAYWTFLRDELPEVVSRFFRVSTAREDTFVAGLSMGGYGAMRWALAQPGRFAAAASLSGALDVVGIAAARWATDLRHVFGGPPTAGSDPDLLALLDRADPAALPALFVTCGTEDSLVSANRTFVARADERGIAVETLWRPGEHEWGFWDAGIQDVLGWLPLRGRPPG